MARRVLYLAWAPFFSGAERALLLTVQHLDPARYQPYVILGSEGDTASAMRAAGIPCEIQPLVHLEFSRAMAWGRSVWAVTKTARRIGASLIHANDVPSHQPGGYAGRLLGLPAIAHVRFPDRNSGFAWFLRSGFARALFVSEYLRADALTDSSTLFEGRADVLHDGVVLPPPHGDAECQALRRELSLPIAAPVIALTGQVSEVKGIWDFVAAAHLLAGRRDSPVFAVLGDDLKGRGALREAMEQRVAALGLSARFRFLGFRPDAPRLIPAFDIIAVPSLVEPLGNATLEAMAAGRPVVGSRVGGIPEMVVDGETGLLVPPGDPAALAAALQRLVDDPGLRSRFGGAARRRAASSFGLPLHAERLQRLYDTLIEGRRR